MPDVETSAPATDDTTVSDEATTSTNEDAQDTESQDLDDMELSDEDIEADETEESGESENKTATTESEEEAQEESEDDVESTDSDSESTDSEQEESTEEGTDSDDDAREAAARRAFEQREAQRHKAKVDAQQEYLDAAEDGKDLALRQLQIDAYNNRVESNTNKLQNGIDKAVASIDLFRTGTLEVKQELTDSLDDFERMHVKRDRNGDPIEVTGDVYQFLQKKADSIRRLTGVGARQQQKDRSKTRSKTITPPAKKPKEPKVDPDIAAFDEEADKW